MTDTDYESAAGSALEELIEAFNKIAGDRGLTGFQASWVAMRFLTKVNMIEGPFAIIKAEDLLFPQYPDPVDTARAREAEWMSWAAEEALKKLRDQDPSGVASSVWRHWIHLVGMHGNPDDLEGIMPADEQQKAHDEYMASLRLENP